MFDRVLNASLIRLAVMMCSVDWIIVFLDSFLSNLLFWLPPACFVMFSRGSKRKIGKKRVNSFHRSMFLYLYSEVFRGYGNEILALNGLLFFFTCRLNPGLRQFQETESPFKMVKNAFYFIFQALFLLKIYTFLS